jgi:sugar phosphate isomerase/epimerase
MSTSRRTFIKNTAVVVAGAALLPETLFAKPAKAGGLGVQLYTVRGTMLTDPKGTLKKLYDAGARRVEHANYKNRQFYGFAAADFKKVLDDAGLKMPSGHTVMTAQDWDAGKNDFTDKWKYTIEDAATVGQHYVISPWLDEALRTDIDGLKRFMQQFNKCGELCKAHGMKFGYHNHNFEFSTMVGQINLYDFILQNTDPALVAQQMDIGNMFGTGGVALDYLANYPGRFELMHVKDEVKSAGKGDLGDGYDSTILGKGVMPVHDIVTTGLKSGGTLQFIIEQESYQGMDPVDCVKIDLDVMKKWGF